MAIDVNADFTPSIPDSGVVPTKLPYNPTGSFKFWAQKVIPLVYDDSLSYYEVLCKVVTYLNNVIQNVDNLNDSVDSTNENFGTLQEYVNSTKDTLINTYNELQTYVNTYFDNLDVQNEINAKLDAMAESGELGTLLEPFIPSLVTAWLNENVTPVGSAVVVDASLSISGAAADAKVTGDKIKADEKMIDGIGVTPIKSLPLYRGNLSDSGAWNNTQNDNYKHCVIPVKEGDKVVISFAGSAQFGVVKTYTTAVNGETIDYSDAEGFTEKTVATANNTYTFTIPADGKFLIVEYVFHGTDVTINKLQINYYDYNQKITDESFIYRGSMAANGITSFAACTKKGYYNFTGSYLDDVSDAPDILKKNGYGGYVFNIPNFGDGRNSQIIIDSHKNMWFGAPTFEPMSFRNIGSIATLEITDLSTIKYVGYFNCPGSWTSSVTDKPTDMASNTGFDLIVLPSSAGNNVVYQIIIENLGSIWFRYVASNGTPSTYIKLHDANAHYLKYNGNVVSLGYTSFATANDYGYYSFTSANLASITDAPSDLENGGILECYRQAASNVVFQKIRATTGDEWFRYSNNPFKRTINAKAGDASNTGINWYVLGDSITQGYYSRFNEGSAPSMHQDWKRSWAYIANESYKFFSLTNYSVGGSGYVCNGTVLDQKNARDHVDDIDFSDCDLCTLSYGINDYKGNYPTGSVTDDPATGGTLCSNMKYVIEKILTDNPLCKIIVTTPLNCRGYDYSYGDKSTNYALGFRFSNSGTLEDVFTAIKSVCEYYGIEMIDATHTSIVNRENIVDALPDGVHPSSDCQTVLGREMSSRISFCG